MPDTQAVIDESVRELIAEIGLPTEFLPGLMADSDWSFVIKLHALIEAAVTHALVVHSGKDEASEVFANLELSNAKTGKLAFSKVFLNLESEDRRFIRSFSELRNSLIHDIRNVSFTLSGYFSGLPIEKQRSFVRDFGYVDYDDESPSGLDKVIAQACSDLRRLMLRSTLALVAILQLQLSTARFERKGLQHRLAIADLVGSNSSSSGRAKARRST
jgi:hypothetical protein